MKRSNNKESGETHVSPDSSRTPVLGPLVGGMDVAGAIVVLAMMVIVNIDVFGRWLLNYPLAGTLELTEMGIVAVVYLQLARTIQCKRLTRSDTFLNYLAKKVSIKVSIMLRLGFNLVGALMLGLIAYGQAPRLIDAWNRGYYTGNVGIFTAPTWPLEAIILSGAVAASIQFMVLGYRNFSSLRDS